MRQTVATEILNYLGNNPDSTDAQIAQGINRPLPSVRRTRLTLERDERIYASASDPLRWSIL